MKTNAPRLKLLVLLKQNFLNRTNPFNCGLFLFLFFIGSVPINLLAENYGLTFDGIDDYVKINPINAFNSIGTGNFTLEARIRVSSSNDQLYPILLSNRTDHDNGVVLFIHTGPESFQSGKLWLNIQGQNYPCSNCPDMRDNLCHHVAVVNDGSYIIFYIDGVEITKRQVLITANNITTNGNFIIGHDAAYGIGSMHFNGEIGEVRIWNEARALEDIAKYHDTFLSEWPNTLVGYWRLAEGTGQSSRNEVGSGNALLGNGNNADTSDPKWVYSCVGTYSAPINNQGKTLEFDGADDYIEIPPLSKFNSIGTGQFTIEARINASSQNSQYYPIIFSNRTNHITGVVVFLNSLVDQGDLWVNIQGTNYSCGAIPSLRDDKCHHIAVVNTGTHIQFYIDGSFSCETAISSNGNNISSSGVLRIGHDAAFSLGANHFKGEISEVRLWNVARTPSEILKDKDLTIISTPNPLVGYWKLNETSGQVAYGIDNHNGIFGSSDQVDSSDPTSETSCSISGTPQYINLPDITTLNCNSRKINLSSLSSGSVKEQFEIISGDAIIENDTLLTVLKPGPIQIRVIAPAQFPYTPTDTIWNLEAIADQSCEISIYNFVSANNDGMNDSFEINMPYDYQYTLTIFNRWGEKIFENEQYNNSWDGSTEPSGSYKYIIKITKPEPKEISGNIHLVK
jgi:gliding motility-associated-like protein